MIGHAYSRSSCDTCVFHQKLSDGSFIYFLLYVSVVRIAAKDIVEIDRLKARLSSKFDMKDLRAAKKILGMKFHRNRQE